MKYLLLVLLLLASGFASAQTVLTVTERKVTVAGGQSYSLFKSNDETLKAASSLAAQACAVNPNSKVYGRITFEYACAKSSSSKSSASSSSVPVQSSAAASSVSARVTLSWSCPTQRQDGAALQESEIGGYIIRANGVAIHNLVPTNCKMSQIVDALPSGQVFEIATYDTNKLFSGYVPFAEN